MNIAVGSLALATLAGAIALGAALFTPLPTEVTAPPAHPAAIAPIAPVAPTSAAWTERAPFRRDRRLSAVEYDARRALIAASAPPSAPKPQLVLRGLVGGSDPAAIVEGLPGTDGPRVVRAGERMGELTVRRIAAARVVISGMDTTWSLELPKRDP